ncbi:hypothetical protein BC938DRAFT_474902 [Jimgerdemannia flammicorona]|uniref:YTH domain-containing protein n=1 Tax=Jimgerdemannia flammicorona TaxID=994334 RepID=A0A433Q1F6_9FUNG|nr:hypothetical protein BC938DRAFT_474902 [Jimgerdemannia flammicorona]
MDTNDLYFANLYTPFHLQTTSTSSSGPHPRSSTSTTISGSVPLLPHPPTPSSSSSSLLSSPRYHPATTTAPPTPEPSSTLSSSLHDTLTPIRSGQRRPSLPLRMKRSIQDMSVSPRSPHMLPHSDGAGGGQHAAQRFFILKSLTNEDLDISVKSGVWATQPHNEPGLNRAFKLPLVCFFSGDSGDS